VQRAESVMKEIRQKDQVIERLRSQLDEETLEMEKDERVQELSTTMKERDETIRRLRGSLATRENEIASVSSDLEALFLAYKSRGMSGGRRTLTKPERDIAIEHAKMKQQYEELKKSEGRMKKEVIKSRVELQHARLEASDLDKKATAFSRQVEQRRSEVESKEKRIQELEKTVAESRKRISELETTKPEEAVAWASVPEKERDVLLFLKDTMTPVSAAGSSRAQSIPGTCPPESPSKSLPRPSTASAIVRRGTSDPRPRGRRSLRPMTSTEGDRKLSAQRPPRLHMWSGEDSAPATPEKGAPLPDIMPLERNPDGKHVRRNQPHTHTYQRMF
jgi:uncharacterized coiled-coil protein SlyX